MFYQHDHPISNYSSNMIPLHGLELGPLWWKIGASSVRYNINGISKELLKIYKVALKILYWKVLGSKNNIASLSYSIFSINCSLVTYLTRVSVKGRLWDVALALRDLAGAFKFDIIHAEFTFQKKSNNNNND